MKAGMDTVVPALCSKHPQVNATLTCERCGTFACESCRSPTGKGLCADCGNRTASEGLAVGDTLRQSFRVLLQHPKALALFGLAYVVSNLVTLPLTHSLTDSRQVVARDIFDAPGWMIPPWLILMIVTFVSSSVYYALFTRFLGDALMGRERPLGETVREGLGRVPPMLGLQLLLTVPLGVGFVLCLVPGIFLLVALSLATPAVVLQAAGPLEAIRLSWERTTGHRMSLFLLLVSIGVPTIGVAIASSELSLTPRPLSLMHMVVGTTLSQAASALLFALLLSILVVCYLRLTGQWRPVTQSR
jgi:hypothetical protein